MSWQRIVTALTLDGVLTTLGACEAPFYLTGGTALHRHYFGFRYSEDLDLFVSPRALIFSAR